MFNSISVLLQQSWLGLALLGPPLATPLIPSDMAGPGPGTWPHIPRDMRPRGLHHGTDKSMGPGAYYIGMSNATLSEV